MADAKLGTITLDVGILPSFKDKVMLLSDFAEFLDGPEAEQLTNAEAAEDFLHQREANGE
jgi:hypothetical protein